MDLFFIQKLLPQFQKEQLKLSAKQALGVKVFIKARR
jgi:hypothetical protein